MFKNIYTYCIVYILILFVGSIMSPLTISSDPGFGFLDMYSLKNGGKFLFHSIPDFTNLDSCQTEMTTWWSPGQWIVPYLISLIGLNLGISISISVLIFSFFGIFGWRKLFYKIGFENRVIEISILLILVSRYFYTPFQIYNGGALLEFAISPWMIYTWLAIKEEITIKKVILVFILMLVSYIFKSSLLLLVILLFCQDSVEIRNRKIKFKKILFYGFFFLTIKYLLDNFFIAGGATPFNSTGVSLSIYDLFRLLTIQRLLFIFSGPFLSTIGIEDYLNYFFQKPGNVLVKDGSILFVLLFSIILSLAALSIYFIYKRRRENLNVYSNLLFLLVFGYILFFLFTFIEGKAISGYNDSRHYRVAGIYMLPFCIEIFITWVKNKVVYFFIALLCSYAFFSYASKLNLKKVIDHELRVSISEISDYKSYNLFLTEAKKVDFLYVISPDHSFKLDQCRTFLYQDDFIELSKIKNRAKVELRNNSILFFLPKRFFDNGKAKAIFSRFTREGKQVQNYETIADGINWIIVISKN